MTSITIAKLQRYNLSVVIINKTKLAFIDTESNCKEYIKGYTQYLK